MTMVHSTKADATPEIKPAKIVGTVCLMGQERTALAGTPA